MTDIKGLIDRVLQLEPEGRTAVLEALDGDSARSRIAEEATGNNGDAPTQLSTEALEPNPGDVAALNAGDRVGPYRILRELGAGGMGMVYHAEQLEPIRRQIALKLIKWGMDTKAVLARFDSERQALALMNHPNIAKVYDAGATAAGRPYFSMEYVPGIPITDYCDQNKLGLKARLELFIQVCAGIQHAHQKGVIHRDIKPGNVLVAIQDEVAIPKIIDFGVAKATSQRLTEYTVATELGQLIGTPAYMSPEQAEMSNLDIDTRSDVYSLGVLLYELLVGTQPFSARELRQKGLAEIQRILRVEEPPRPSTRFSSLGQGSQISAANRQLEPRLLEKQVRGDLDWITMKALEKDRIRRYDSPGELARDLKRHLNNDPIQARAPTTAYRLRKFVLRHRIGVGVTSGLLLTLFGVLILSLVQSQRLAVERDRAELALSRAESESAKSNAINAFVQDMLGSASPYEGAGKNATVREVLDKAADSIDSAFADQPEVKAAVQSTVGRTYYELGRYREAQQLLYRSLAARERILGPDHPDVAETLGDLGWVLRDSGEMEQAEQLFERALAIYERAHPAGHPDTAEILNDLANLYERQQRYVEGEQLFQRALQMRNALYGSSSLESAEVIKDLAWMLFQADREEEAELKFREALSIYEAPGVPEHPDLATTLTGLAYVHQRRAEYTAGENLHLRALAIRRRLLGPEHLGITYSLHGLAATRREMGDYPGAEGYVRESLAIKEKAFGPDYYEIAHGVSLLAWLVDQRGERSEAEALYRRALRIYRDQDKTIPDSRRVATGLNNLAMFYGRHGECDRAEPLFQEALAHYASPEYTDSWSAANLRTNYAGCLLDQGRLDQAEPLLLAAHQVLAARFGDDHWRTQKASRHLVRLYEMSDRPGQARRFQATLPLHEDSD